MNSRKITCMAAATFVGSLLVLSAVAPVHAQAPVVVQGHRYFDPEIQRVVHYGDLNLAEASGQKALIRRVAYAVGDVCGTNAIMTDRYDAECTTAAWDSANFQITAAFDQARTGSDLPAVAVPARARH